LQKNGQYLSEAEIGSRQQELAQLEKNYTNKEQQLSQEFGQEESFKRLQEVKKKIEAFLAIRN
jgi:outer membrane protein